MSTIAVLVPSQTPAAIDQRMLAKVLTRPNSVRSSPEGLVITSHRDGIEAIMAGNKINVRDLSGRQDFSDSKIPQVLHLLVSLVGRLEIMSYGVNFLLTVPCAESARWVAGNILAAGIQEKTGKTVVGGTASLKMECPPKTWTIRLEPGESDTIAVDFNASQELPSLPPEERLRGELREQFELLLQFLRELGLRQA